MYKRIIVIVGMPRSGTSWLCQIIESSPLVRFKMEPLFSYKFKNIVNEYSSRDEYEKLFINAYNTNDEFIDHTFKRKNGSYPTFNNKLENPPVLAIKQTRFHNIITRMMEYFENLKMVSIVRHPCGAINSWLKTPKEFPKNANPLLEWRYGECRKTGPEEFWGFEDWKKITRLHMDLEKKYSGRFIIVQYEYLVEHALEGIKSLFEFLDLEFGNSNKIFIKESQSKHMDDTHAVFKSPEVKDKWREELNPEIREQIIKEIKGTDLERFLV